MRIYSSKFLLFVVLNLATFIVIIAFFSLVLKLKYSSNKSYIPTWNNTKDVVTEALLQQVVSSASLNKLDEKSIKVMQIPSQGAGNIFVFDFRSHQLCGSGGCLYQVYHESGRLLLEVMANGKLPPKQELIKVSNSNIQAFPCLTFTQTTAIENMVSHTDYCFDSGRYIRVNETVRLSSE